MSIANQPKPTQVGRVPLLDEPLPEVMDAVAEAFREALQQQCLVAGVIGGEVRRSFIDKTITVRVTPLTPILPLVRSWVRCDEEREYERHGRVHYFWQTVHQPVVCELDGACRKGEVFELHYYVRADETRFAEEV